MVENSAQLGDKGGFGAVMILRAILMNSERARGDDVRELGI